MKALGQTSLTVNPDAPTELTEDEKKTLQNHPMISRLRSKRDATKAAAEAASREARKDLLKKKGLAEASLQAAN
ncbi:MAG: hypothetical protein M1828_003004, partial [Chrysothrix sp. TS-e1954]